MKHSSASLLLCAAIKAVLSESLRKKSILDIDCTAWATPGLLLLPLVAFFISRYQIFGESPDYVGYDLFFDSLRSSGFDIFWETRFEPGFAILGLALVALVSSNLVVYGLIGAIAVFLKGLVVNLFSSNRAVFCALVIFYFARFFPLHELTQLRVALAAAMLLVAAACLWNGKKALGLMACLVALTFHVSAIIVIPFLFVQATRRWKAVLAGVFVFVCIFFGVDLLINELTSSVPLVDMYQHAGFGEVPNPLSAALLLDWATIIAGLGMWNRLPLAMKRVLLLQLIGMAIFYSTSDFAVASHRIREFFTVFWLIFFAQGLQIGSVGKAVSAVFLIVNVGLYSYLFVFSGQFFS